MAKKEIPKEVLESEKLEQCNKCRHWVLIAPEAVIWHCKLGFWPPEHYPECEAFEAFERGTEIKQTRKL